MQKKIKNILVIFLTLLLVICNVTAAAYSQINLISNSGFETGSMSSWTVTTGSLTSIAAQSAIKQSGSYAVQYYLNSATSGVKYGSISQSVNFDSAGSTLTVYTFDHASGGTGYTYYNIYIDGTTYGTALPSTSTADGTWNSWVKHDIDISTICGGSACTGTKTLTFEIGYGSNHYGDVYIDTTSLLSTAPTASFTGTPVRGAAPLTVNFVNTDTHVTAYGWDFGDGTTSTSPNPSHQYTTPSRQYTVIHTATNLGGDVTQTRTNYITTNATVAAAFSGTPVSGNTPLSVTFTDASTGSPYAWNWSFGDGTVGSTQNPTHSYASAGSFTVRLDITAPDGTAYTTKTNYITATGTAAHAGMAIGGRIYDKLSLTGLNAVQMTLVNATSGSWSTTTFTNTTGYYAFNNLSTSTSNNYVVSSVKSGYLDTATDPFTLTAEEVAASYADRSFGMEVIGSSSGANQGLGGKYAPNLVRFTIKYWYGEPIKGVNVTAQGFESTAGSGSFADAITTLGSLFGFDFVTTPIANTLMMGTTGDDGSITFYMVENVNYHITFTLNGVELVTPINVYPKEFEYPITVPSLATSNSAVDTNSSFTSGSVNNSYSYITVSYRDTNYRTTTAAVTFEKVINSSYSQPISTTPYIGAAAANFTNTIYVLSRAGDQYYATLTTVNTDFGTRNETKLITIPGRILDLRLANTDYYAWISLIAIYFIAQMGGSRRTRDVAIVMTFFALFLTLAGWLSITTLLLQAAVLFAVLYYVRTAEEQ